MLVSLAILLHMVRRFLANLSYLFVINLLIKPLYIFGIEVQVQNVVGAGEYGIFASDPE